MELQDVEAHRRHLFDFLDAAVLRTLRVFFCQLELFLNPDKFQNGSFWKRERFSRDVFQPEVLAELRQLSCSRSRTVLPFLLLAWDLLFLLGFSELQSQNYLPVRTVGFVDRRLLLR